MELRELQEKLNCIEIELDKAVSIKESIKHFMLWYGASRTNYLRYAMENLRSIIRDLQGQADAVNAEIKKAQLKQIGDIERRIDDRTKCLELLKMINKQDACSMVFSANQYCSIREIDDVSWILVDIIERYRNTLYELKKEVGGE